MNPEDLKFHRLFSKTMYKNLKLPMGEMTFTKDFVSDKRGDLYPVIHRTEDCIERVEKNEYRIECGKAERVIGAFFPYATYEITYTLSGGSCGFTFNIPGGRAVIKCSGHEVRFTEKKDGIECSRESVPLTEKNTETLIVSCRPGAFDVFFLENDRPDLLTTFKSEAFRNSHSRSVFEKGFACVAVRGGAVIHAASFYIDCGMSQADLRPIRYENGDVMYENGLVYLTASIRMQEEKFQGIFSWVPSTSEFHLTGALFYDSGDDYWEGDVAASLLWHREKKQWYLWVCSFSHDHILGHSVFSGDPRFGVNVVDITLMPKAPKGSSITEFWGFEGDEDPDFYYDEKEKKWTMAVCRMDPSVKGYRYIFFRSDSPFEGYEYIGQGSDGAETGGSFVTFEGEKIFVCGNDFNKTSDYRIYTKEGMKKASFDFPDGGFRGWGSIIPIKMGSRRRYFWITFDRHNASNYNWSYGNIYCFEAQLR